MTPKEFQEILRDSRGLESLLGCVGDDIIVVCPAGNIVYLNRKGPLGAPSMIGRDLFQGPLKERQRARKAFHEAMRTGRPQTYESECAPFGRRGYYAATINPLRWKGKLRGAVIVARDISRRRKAELELESSREMLDVVMANVPDYVMTIDRRFRITYINRTAKGLRMSQVIGSSAFDYLSPGDKARWRREMRQAFQTGRPLMTEVQALGDSGQMRHYLNRLQPIFSDGRVESLLLVASDITDRKRAELEAAASREMLDGVLANIPAYVCLMDKNGRLFYVNKVEKGLTMDHFIGKSAIDFAHPADRPRLRKAIRQALRTGQPGFLETRRVGPQGQMLCYANSFWRILDKRGGVSILSVTTDVTEIRAAEDKLKESQESYRLIFEANPSPMVVGDRATHQWLAVNDAAIKHYGYSHREWLRMSSKDIHPPDEMERLRRYRIDYGLTSHGVWKQKKKDGTIIDVDITTNSLRFQGREAIMGVFRDVTAERRVQTALQRSRQDYLRLFQGHPLPMWVGDYQSLKILDVNAAAVKAFGYSRDEFLGKKITELRPKSELSALLHSIRTKTPGAGFRTRSVYCRKDGARFEADVYVSDVEFEGRRAFITSVMDISEQVKGREAQERFASLFNASRDGMNFIDLGGRIREVNQAFCRMLGYSRGELLGKHTILSLTPPEYHEMNRAAFKQLLSTGEAVEYEKEYIRKDGSRVPVSLTAFVLPGADGRPAGMAGIVRDISERKRLEKEILEVGAREQSSIGRELHDSLGQHLTGVSFLAKSLKTQLSREGSQQARLAERIAQTASDAVEQVRALAAGLVPAELLPDGLPAALQAMAVQAEKTFGIECSLRCPSRLTGMEVESLLHLYRIAQEAVANAAKHSGAKRVRISMKELKRQVILEVSDNGKGISRRDGKGLGLKIMAHRAQMLGGTFEIKKGKTGGTIATCTCPSGRPLL